MTTEERAYQQTLTLRYTPMPWADRAACQNAAPEAFFPEKSEPAEPGKRVCSRCPVVEECLEYALSNDMWYGTWGGLSEHERRRLRREMGRVHGWTSTCVQCERTFTTAAGRASLCSEDCRRARRACRGV